MYACLDSDILIDFLRNNRGAVAKIQKLSTKYELATTSVNSFEIFLGAYLSEFSQKNLEKAAILMSSLHILELKAEQAQAAARICAEAMKEKQPLDVKDILIAGIALENNAMVVTKNIRHFERVKGLEIESW